MYLMFQTWDRDQDGKFAAEVFFFGHVQKLVYM